MKKHLLILSFIVIAQGLTAQKTTDFENFNLPLDTFLNGSDFSGGFESGDVFIPNIYSSDFGGFWSGFAVSTMQDTVSSGFNNQYSAITGGGAENSDSYAVAYDISGGLTILLQGDAAKKAVEGFYVTNGTYPYLSMLNGDNFAKRFGGETGDDPDFYKLKIRKFLNGELNNDIVEFYLADYRFADNSQDYIVDTWEWVNLTSLGTADSLFLTVESSDVGGYGINTPTYYMIDGIVTGAPVSKVRYIEESFLISVFPNPTMDEVFVQTEEKVLSLRLMGHTGNTLMQLSNQDNIDLKELPAGIYFLEVESSKGTVVRKIVKQ